MIYQVEDIKRDVRTALDENRTGGQLLAEEDRDTLSLDELIVSKVEEAVRRVHLTAPLHMLEPGHHFGDNVHWNADGKSGWTLLPDDFLRLTGFRMSDWERTVRVALRPEESGYEMQSSRFAGIRGTRQRPVCAITTRPEGLALEFWSCADDRATVTQATYTPESRIDANGGIDISPRLRTETVYMAAALTAYALGETEKGNMLAELAKTTGE